MWHRAARACRLTLISNLLQRGHTFASLIQTYITRPVLERILNTQGARDRSVPIHYVHPYCGCGLRRPAFDSITEGRNQRLLVVAIGGARVEGENRAVAITAATGGEGGREIKFCAFSQKVERLERRNPSARVIRN